jgi:hypothetical protein
MNKLKYVAAVLIGIAGLGLQAKADTFTSFINSGNSGLSGFSGPFVKVTITTAGPNSTTANVQFTSLTNTFNGSPIIYLMGDGGSADLNVNSTFTVSNLTKSNSGTGFLSTHNMGGNQVNDLSFQIGAGQNVDDQGTFNLTINNFDGFTHAADTISFTLTNTGGTWANAGSVLFFNSDGIDAAAHVFPSLSPAVASNNFFNVNTGFAGETAGSVPDGGTTVMLLGMALGGLGMLGMARRWLKT